MGLCGGAVTLCRFHILVLLLAFHAFGQGADDPRSEADTLLLLRASFLDPMGFLADWGKEDDGVYGSERKTDPCYPPWPWTGVGCDSENRSVTVLDLAGSSLAGQSSLAGTIPTELTSLKNLSGLYLTGNSIAGWIPGNIVEMENLLHLYLGDNQLTGLLPQFPPRLRELHLENNLLRGELPSLFNLTDCYELRLYGNRFTGGLGKMRMFELVDLSDNLLAGPFPNLFPSDVRVLRLSRNLLEGGISDNINWLDANDLGILDLSGNKLNGSIPVHLLQNVSSLVDLNLSNNTFSGTIDLRVINSRWSQHYGMQLIDLSFNQLENTADLEPSSYSAENWSRLSLRNNRFSGKLDKIFGTRFAQLRELLLGGNRFEAGDVGLLLQNMSANVPLLQALDLHGSGLAGQFSSTLLGTKTLPYLRFLDLSDNNLTGVLTNDLAEMSNLQVLLLHHNTLQGSISGNASWPPSLPNLVMLDLGHNLLDVDEAGIQAVLESSPDMRELRLAGCNGGKFISLPILDREHSALEILDLSSCSLIGQIPANFSSFFPSLKSVNLSNNLLQGSLPEGFAEMRELIEVDVSDNQLSGTVPVFPFRPVYVAYARNAGLCSPSVGDCGRDNTHQTVIIVVAVIAVVVISGVTLFIGWIWRRKVDAKMHRQDAELIAMLLERDTTSLMSLRELRKATDDFSEDNQIGVGGFGVVFKGVLEDGTMVAIKRSKRDASTSEDKTQFLNEVKILSQVHHRNLVRLLGCCLANKNALLVFEFVANGTVDEHLRILEKHGHTALTWNQRLRIAIQTAGALDYLHSCANPPIYHLDVKSSNILLDNELNAKVSDFGISKLAPASDATHITTLHGFQGTFGYMDPELVVKSVLTGKSDVYAFGVVLLELITAKPVIDRSRGEDISLVRWAGKLTQMGKLEEVTDPVLLDTYRTSDGRRSIDAVASLAQECLLFRSEDRPTMGDVSRSLLDIQEGIQPSNPRSFFHPGNDDIEIELSSVSHFTV